MPTKFSCFLSILLLPIFSFSQTFDIVRVTSSMIIVGADSKSSSVAFYIDSTGKRKFKNISSTNCKISHVGNIYFVIAGIMKIELIKEIYRTTNNFDDLVSEFIPLIKTDLDNNWEFIRNIDSSYYRKNIQPAEITFVSFDGKHPRAIYIVFIPTFNPLATANFKLLTKLDISSKKIAIPMGHKDGMVTEVTSDSTWDNKDPGKVIKALIEKQMLKAPDIIGKPIDILELTSTGAKWLGL